MFIDFTPDPQLYPLTSHWFPSRHGQLHYTDDGAGEVTVLFCHGSPTWSFLYRKTVAALRDRFRCITVDQLGFGLSERPAGCRYTIAEHAEALGDLIDSLDLDRVVLVGHDWGGPIGLAALVDRPGIVQGITLCNTVFWPVRALPNRAFSLAMSSRPLQRRIIEKNLLVERFLIAELGAGLSATEAAHYRGVQPTPESRVGLAATPAQIRAATPLLADLEDRVATLFRDTQTLALWGMRDPMFRARACLPRVQAAFTRLRIVELSDVGHFVPELAADRLTEEIAGAFG